MSSPKGVYTVRRGPGISEMLFSRERTGGTRDRNEEIRRRKTRRVVTLKLKKCSDDWDRCQWKCMLFKVMLL